MEGRSFAINNDCRSLHRHILQPNVSNYPFLPCNYLAKTAQLSSSGEKTATAVNTTSTKCRAWIEDSTFYIRPPWEKVSDFRLPFTFELSHCSQFPEENLNFLWIEYTKFRIKTNENCAAGIWPAEKIHLKDTAPRPQISTVRFEPNFRPTPHSIRKSQ